MVVPSPDGAAACKALRRGVGKRAVPGDGSRRQRRLDEGVELVQLLQEIVLPLPQRLEQFLTTEGSGVHGVDDGVVQGRARRGFEPPARPYESAVSDAGRNMDRARPPCDFAGRFRKRRLRKLLRRQAPNSPQAGICAARSGRLARTVLS